MVFAYISALKNVNVLFSLKYVFNDILYDFFYYLNHEKKSYRQLVAVKIKVTEGSEITEQKQAA